MYSGCNENKHHKILKKLVKLGADVQVYDLFGSTPLHYAACYHRIDMVTVLLRHGANPNSESRVGDRPLSYLSYASTANMLEAVNELIQYGARLTLRNEINQLRNSVETFGSKELAIIVREAHPREKEECEKCVKPATKQCSACGLVYYCTPACQKLDWKFHKVTCQKNKKE